MSLSGTAVSPIASLAAGSAAGVKSAPSHLVHLPGTNWNLWRSFVVRSAGFPAAIINELAAPQTVAAADHYLACRALASRHMGATMRSLRKEQAGSANLRRELEALKTAIATGNMEAMGDSKQARAAADAHKTAQETHETFTAAFHAEMETVHNRLIDFACEPRFREAMLWQGLDPTHNIWHNLQPESPAHARRKALRQITMRVQRYAVKNDSIGFFGPVAWGTIVEDAIAIEEKPGPELLANRTVFFEGWTIDALAAALDTKELKPWMAPRIKAGIWIHEGRAYRHQRTEVRLSEEERAVLAHCDGKRTARELAQAVLKERRLPSGTQEKDVFELLEQLMAAGLIMWRLEVPSQLHPEVELANRLARIEDAAWRQRCTSALNELLESRHQVALAAGNAVELDKALQGLHGCFTGLTAQPCSRRGGQTYGARTLVYEDCRRDCEIQVGTKLLNELAQPLGVLLDGARWALAEVGSVIKTQLRTCLAELLELHKESGEEVDCHLFFEYVHSNLYADNGKASAFGPLTQQFQDLWKRVLGRALHASANRVVFSSEEACARAASIFPPREVGFTLGRYVSPDVMIAASSIDAIRRGEYFGVLGEVHCDNTLVASCLVTQHPCPRVVMQAAFADTRDEFVVSLHRPNSAWLARANDVFIQPHHWRYLFNDDPPHHPLCRALPAGMLRVTDTGSAVVVRAIDGSVQFDALELFGGPATEESSRLMNEFFPPLPHVPRISLGNLVIAREQWNFVPADLPFLAQKDPARQFLDIRAWGKANGMPRRVFVKSPAERKPWFLDFDSPMLTAAFISLMKKVTGNASVRLTEMLPDLDHLWLTDSDGRRFTSELRLAARAVPGKRAAAH
ncbi:MAG TPA: lantibiotic dehydratase [Candidatus Angelobacter sp.]|jgi:hypothetical protein